MSRRVRGFLIGGVIAIAAIGITSFILHREFDQDPSVRRFRSMVGKSASEVRRELGEPQRIYEKTTAPPDYYERGYTYEERPITGKVYIYFGEPDLIAYVYVDPSDRVEHVFVGAS